MLIKLKNITLIVFLFICSQVSFGQVLFEDFEGEPTGAITTSVASVYQIDNTGANCGGSESWNILSSDGSCNCSCIGVGCASKRAVINYGHSLCVQTAVLRVGTFTGETSVDISFDWAYQYYRAGDQFRAQLFNVTTNLQVGANMVDETTTSTDNGTYGATTHSGLNAAQVYEIRFVYNGAYSYGAQVDNILVTTNCIAPTALFSVSPDCGNGQFYIDVNVTNLGAGSDVDISNSAGVATTVAAGTGTTTIGPFAYSTNVVVTVDGASYGGCDVSSTTMTEDCACATPPTATVTTTNLNCGTGTFDIQVASINNGSGTSSDIYVNNVLDVAGSELLGKTASTNYTVTIKATGSGSLTCETDYNGITASCATPCAGNATTITDGYTQNNITTPGVGGVDDWVGEAESCGTAATGEFEDSDVKIYAYTTGANAGENIYFTIEYDYANDKSHSIGVWENCINDSLTNCVTSYYNFDDVAGVCVQGLAANTTYYIGVSNNYFNEEALDFDIIDFTVETSTTIPEDECVNAQTMSITNTYNGSTRCSYTASAASPSGCGTIENDSWIAFVADSVTSVIDYTVSNCSKEWGVQLSVWSGACGSLSMLSGSCINYAANNSAGTWTLTGMTVGQTYYIRADGYAGDLCGYSYTPISGVLPITLTEFTGEALKTGYNRLNWTTAAEVNNNYFVIESAVDAINFEEVATQSGAGNSSSVLHYFDYHKPSTETTYYRLKQVDFNGDYSYSDVIVIKNANSGFNIYPNPSNDGFINIDQLKGNEQITITNLHGKIVEQFQNNAAVSKRINLSNLSKGMYYVVVRSGDEVLTEKLILD